MKISEALQNPDTTAVSLYVAARTLCDGACMDEWEPESIRLHFKDEGLSVPEENFQAILAVRTMRTNPAFLWDANVFENTILALNDEPVDPGSIQYVAPPQIAWGLEQAKHLTPDDWSLDYEPVAYVVASCIHYGLVACPAELDFAKDELERLTPHADALRALVKKGWAEIKDLKEHPYAEDAVGVQLALLASVTIHVAAGKARLSAELEQGID